MIKTWLKHKLFELSIDTTMNGIITSLNSSPRWIKGSQIYTSHIGMTVIDINYGICPNRMLAKQFKSAIDSTIVPYQQLDSNRGMVVNYIAMIETKQVGYRKYIPIFNELMYQLK